MNCTNYTTIQGVQQNRSHFFNGSIYQLICQLVYTIRTYSDKLGTFLLLYKKSSSQNRWGGREVNINVYIFNEFRQYFVSVNIIYSVKQKPNWKTKFRLPVIRNELFHHKFWLWFRFLISLIRLLFTL